MTATARLDQRLPAPLGRSYFTPSAEVHFQRLLTGTLSASAPESSPCKGTMENKNDDHTKILLAPETGREENIFEMMSLVDSW